MSRLRQRIQERNNQLSDNDTEDIERVLQEFRARRLSKREAAQQLREYVPEEKQANLAGMGMDDLLPLVGLLIGDSTIRGGIGSVLGRFFNSEGGILGGLLGGNNRRNDSDFDLRNIVGGILDGREDDSNSRRKR
jgi:hypothetical protein